MKVLHISPSYFPATTYGGPIVSVHLLNKYLVKNGVSVDVYTTTAGINNFDNLNFSKSWNFIDNIKVKYFKYYGYEHFTFSPGLFIESYKTIALYDIIHITAVWNFPVLAGSIVSILKKKPFIISPRGTIYDEAINMRSKYKKKIFLTLIGKYYLKASNAIHYTSQNEQDKSFKYTGSKGFIIPNGLDLAEYSRLPKKDEFKNKYPALRGKKIILFLGRISPKKGLDILIDSFRKLNKIRENVFLVIVGPDNENYKEDLIKIIKSYGLQNKIIFTGFLDGYDKLSVLVDSDVFVLPSYSENFGMSVIEAMACRVPVVISNMVGISNSIKENQAGIIVEANSNSVTNGILKLMDNDELTKNIISNAYVYVSDNYDIKKVAKKMINIYERIVSNANISD